MLPPADPEYVELEDCEIKAVTSRAVLICHDDEEFWVPKSVIQDPEEYERNDLGCVVLVQEWFARKASMI